MKWEREPGRYLKLNFNEITWEAGNGTFLNEKLVERFTKKIIPSDCVLVVKNFGKIKKVDINFISEFKFHEITNQILVGP